MEETKTDTKLIVSIIIVFVLIAGIIAFALTRPAKNDTTTGPDSWATAENKAMGTSQSTTSSTKEPSSTSVTNNNSSTSSMEPQTALEKGNAFLTENAKKPGVIVLPSGLQYKIITQGTGPKPTASQTVKVNYEGTLIDGTIFDSSYKRGEPIEFGVTQVIKGWVEGLQLMPVGSTYMFYIPSNLAYGSRGAGASIGPDETLVFKVELLAAHN